LDGFGEAFEQVVKRAGIPKRKYFPKGGMVYVNSIEGHEVEAGLPAPDRLPARPGVHQLRRRDGADVQGICPASR